MSVASTKNKYLLILLLSLPLISSCQSSNSTPPPSRKSDDELKAEQLIQDAIQKGADLNQLQFEINGQGGLIAMAAAHECWPDAIELLLSHGVSPDLADAGGTLLHRSVSYGFPKCAQTVQLLIQHGANVKALDSLGMTPLYYATEVDNKKETAEILIKNSDEYKTANANAYLPLLNAAGSGSEETAELLLNSGANVNAPNPVGVTPLHCAAMGGFAHEIEILIAHGADVNAKDSKGLTPLDYCEQVANDPNRKSTKRSGEDYPAALKTLQEHAAQK